MKICVLTSTRADYGIYLPLLKKMQADKKIDLRIIAFGTHMSKEYGHTVDVIKKDGLKIDYALNTLPSGDSAKDIALAVAETQKQFALIWNKTKYDLIFCLGDRYEMYAAVSAGVPFNLKFAHLYGGETTLGAIDDVYRHCLTLFSALHFTALPQNSARAAEIKGNKKNIFTVGSLSLDNLKDIPLLNKKEFEKTYGIDTAVPTLLVTFHPETVNLAANKQSLKELLAALNSLNMQTVITMPNSDTMGLYFRKEFKKYAAANKKVFLVESFGTRGYFSAMKHCALMLGNSSSGIIEAASLGCYVINIGDRQKGRACGKNVFHCAPQAKAIVKTAKAILKKSPYKGPNIYWRGGAAAKTVKIIKEYYEKL